MPQLKVVVTGSNGLLGQTLVNLLVNENRFEVFALSRGENKNNQQKGYTYYNVDLTDEYHLTSVLNELRPDFIVNTAAMTHVDVCEDKKEACDKLNVEAVNTLIGFCKEHNVHLVHLSTDFVFDGKQGYYKETDAPNPLSHYGRSKERSEKNIISSGISHTILRTILVFGQVDNMNRSNIVLWVKESLENKRPIKVVDDQFRMPTAVEDLAKACLLSIDKRAQGVFHISSEELFSVYEIAQQIAEVFELDTSYISATSSSVLNQKAHRPPKTGFDLEKSKRVLGFYPQSFKESLQKFKSKLV